MSGDPVKLLSVEEFASCIGRSARTVFRYVSQGRLKAVTVTDVGRNGVRIPQSELSRFNVVVSNVHVDEGTWQTEMADGAHRDAAGVRVGNASADVGSQESPNAVALSANGEETVSGHVTALDILGRYEAAIMRLGFMEGELSTTRRMLGDGGAREAELRRKIEAAEQQAQAEVRAREEAARDAELLRQKVALLEAQLQRGAVEAQATQTGKAPTSKGWRRWFHFRRRAVSPAVTEPSKEKDELAGVQALK